MEHGQVERNHTVERYLLDELSEADRSRFEEHYFSCESCAAEVKAGTAFVANLEAVLVEPESVRNASREQRKPWWAFQWPTWNFAPLAAAASMAMLLGVVVYQNAFQIPQIRARATESGPLLAMVPITRAGASRAGEALTFSRSAGTIPLTIRHEWEQNYPRYSAELKRQDGSVAARVVIPSAPGDFSVTISSSALSLGRYTLAINGIKEDSADDVVVLERIPLKLTE